MSNVRPHGTNPLAARAAGASLAVIVLVIAMCTLGGKDDPVALYLKSGRTDGALVAAVETNYLSNCLDETKASAVTVAQAYSAYGMELHCRCSMDWFLQHAGEQDLRALLERGELTSAAQVTEAAARERCMDELTKG